MSASELIGKVKKLLADHPTVSDAVCGVPGGLPLVGQILSWSSEVTPGVVQPRRRELPPVGTVVLPRSPRHRSVSAVIVEQNGQRVMSFNGRPYGSPSAAAMAALVALGIRRVSSIGWDFWDLPR